MAFLLAVGLWTVTPGLPIKVQAEVLLSMSIFYVCADTHEQLPGLFPDWDITLHESGVFRIERPDGTSFSPTFWFYGDDTYLGREYSFPIDIGRGGLEEFAEFFPIAGNYKLTEYAVPKGYEVVDIHAVYGVGDNRFSVNLSPAPNSFLITQEDVNNRYGSNNIAIFIRKTGSAPAPTTPPVEQTAILQVNYRYAETWEWINIPGTHSGDFTIKQANGTNVTVTGFFNNDFELAQLIYMVPLQGVNITGRLQLVDAHVPSGYELAYIEYDNFYAPLTEAEARAGFDVGAGDFANVFLRKTGDGAPPPSDADDNAVNMYVRYFDVETGQDVSNTEGQHTRPFTFKRGDGSDVLINGVTVSNPANILEYVINIYNPGAGAFLIEANEKPNMVNYPVPTGYEVIDISYFSRADSPADVFNQPVAAPFSVVVNVRRAESDIKPPTGFSCEAIPAGVLMKWNPSTGGVGYRVYRSTNPNDEGISITDFYITCNEFIDVNVRSNTTYYYSIRQVISEARPLDGIRENLSPATDKIRITTGTVIGDTLTPPSAGAQRQFILMTLNDPTMNINGVKQEIDPGRGTTPILLNNRTLVPIRAIVEGMGGTVGWQASNGEITLDRGSIKVVMWVDRLNINVNGVTSTIDVPPTIINERTMVPIRFAAENLDAAVDWLNSTRQIVIVFY
jgi:hypothetical protein